MSQDLPLEEQEYAGQRLGLPAEGSGSVAGWGRRVVALFLDWFASLLVTQVVAVLAGLSEDAERSLPLLVFFLEVTFFTALAAGSFGQLVVRIAVVRLDRRPVTVLAAAARTMLICLVIPPVVFNRDNRGLHDLATGTVTLLR